MDGGLRWGWAGVTLLCGLLVAVAARPQGMLLLRNDSPVAAVSYTGPGDLYAGFKAWWGLRAYSAAYAAATSKAINIIRASDSRTCDVNVATTGGLGVTASCSTGGDNGTAVATWCNATTCSVITAYDQSGDSNDATQGTAAERPTLVFSCLGTLPCMRYARAATSFINKATVLSLVDYESFSTVVNRTGNTSSVNQVVLHRCGIQFAATANLTMTCGSGFNVSATNSAWHAVNGFSDVTAGFLRVDSTTNTGANGSPFVVTNASLGTFNADNTAGTCDCDIMEGGIGTGPTTMTTTEASNLNTNQHAYYGF